jgi:SAM-dependent methyltransferase
MESKDKQLGESEEWEGAYLQTRRNMGLRKRRLAFFDWPANDAHILDLGAGDGLDRQALMDDGFSRVTCIDISPRLLVLFSGLRTVADAHKLPFETGSIDGILANSVLHHFDPPRALEEIARVLRPGGRLYYMEPRPCFARSTLDWLTLSFEPGQAINYFRARRVSLMEEMDVYSHWLDIYPQVPGWLSDYGMTLDKKRHTVVGVLAQWRKE